MNPVLFDDYVDDEQLVVLSEDLGAYAWKHRLVGMVGEGFLCVDKRVRKIGSYQFHPKLLPHAEVQQVCISRHFAWKGVLGGILLVLFGVCIVLEGWIGDEITGSFVVWGPFVCLLSGLALILGAVRNRIAVESVRGTFAWISPVLQYKQTLDICRNAEAWCRQARIPCTSHVDD